MPGPPFRSTLEPFLDFITQERRKRLTWKAIAQAIRDRGTPCTPQGVQDYFRRRRKPRRLPLGFEPEPQRSPAHEQETTPAALAEQRAKYLKEKEKGKPTNEFNDDKHII
jgi:hypothetical protein